MAGDEQDEAELVDADEIDPDDFPADRPVGLADTLAGDITSAGDIAPDTFAGRSWREEPDVLTGGTGDEDVAAVVPGRLLDPGDPFGADTTAERYGEAAPGGQLSGVPGERDDEVVDELDLSDSTVRGHGSDRWPAEEAALHIEGEPEDPTISDIVADNEAGS